MSAPRVITRSDDLGSFLSANRAIAATCQQGICRNVSVMAATPNIEHAAEILAGRTDICFGLHADITCEWAAPHRWGPVLPAEEVPALIAEDGCFVPGVKTVHDRGAPFGQIMAELNAQLSRLRDLGFDVRYVDNHMGFDWIHPPGEQDNRLSRRLEQWCSEEGLVWHRAFECSRLPDHEPGIEGLCRAIAQLEDNAVYLMVNHPCYDDDEMRAVAPWDKEPGGVGVDRDQQRLSFMDSEVIAAIEARGVRLARYDEMI